MLDRELKPYAKVLEVSGFPDAAQAGARESYWISKLQSEGIELVNMTTGSPGTPGLVVEMTEETKNLISENMKIYKEDVYQQVLEMKRAGAKIDQICEKTGMSRSTYFKEFRAKIEKDLKGEA
jgi:hypothetical protein